MDVGLEVLNYANSLFERDHHNSIDLSCVWRNWVVVSLKNLIFCLEKLHHKVYNFCQKNCMRMFAILARKMYVNVYSFCQKKLFESLEFLFKKLHIK